MERKISKRELIFILFLLLPALFLWIFLSLPAGGRSGMISITVDGKPYGSYALSEAQIIRINDTNVCEIKNGRARMTHATCPDGLCLHQSAVTGRGGMIICLPNKVIIQADASSQSEDIIDAGT